MSTISRQPTPGLAALARQLSGCDCLGTVRGGSGDRRIRWETCELDVSSICDGLPYHDAGFRRRLLDLQLSEETDQGSRRRSVISAEVARLRQLLPAAAFRLVLQPLCGPGKYAECFDGLGERYIGVDINDVTVAYARSRIGYGRATFLVGDVSAAWDCGPGAKDVSLLLLSFEALNAFEASTASRLISSLCGRCCRAAFAVVELRAPHSSRAHLGAIQTSLASSGSLFDAGPHILRTEPFKLPDVEGHHFYVIDERRSVQCFASKVWLHAEQWVLGEFAKWGFRLFSRVGRVDPGLQHEDSSGNQNLVLCRETV